MIDDDAHSYRIVLVVKYVASPLAIAVHQTVLHIIQPSRRFKPAPSDASCCFLLQGAAAFLLRNTRQPPSVPSIDSDRYCPLRTAVLGSHFPRPIQQRQGPH